MEIRLNAPVLYNKFQFDLSMHLHFIAIFEVCKKVKDKKKKQKNFNKTLGART